MPASDYKKYYAATDYKDTTIVISVRIDSSERLCNLEIVTDGLLKLPGLQIIVLEADAASKLTLTSDIGHIFVEDHNSLFHRTKYLNMLSGMTETKFLALHWKSFSKVETQTFWSLIVPSCYMVTTLAAVLFW